VALVASRWSWSGSDVFIIGAVGFALVVFVASRERTPTVGVVHSLGWQMDWLLIGDWEILNAGRPSRPVVLLRLAHRIFTRGLLVSDFRIDV